MDNWLRLFDALERSKEQGNTLVQQRRQSKPFLSHPSFNSAEEDSKEPQKATKPRIVGGGLEEKR